MWSPELREDALSSKSDLKVRCFPKHSERPRRLWIWKSRTTTATSLITTIELRGHLILISLEMQLRRFHKITIQWPLHCRNTINLKLTKGNKQLKTLRCVAYQLKCTESANMQLSLNGGKSWQRLGSPFKVKDVTWGKKSTRLDFLRSKGVHY